ncbi:hypothetical protein [Terriglobus sp.]|uniref:hypothetical protein n=1 Tax=Terriglobus sp. TaxID=1889013 RepID=UPI003AFFE5FB
MPLGSTATLIAIVSAFWFLLTFPVATKYTGRAGWIIMAAGEIFVVALMSLIPRARANGTDIPRWTLPVLWLALVAAYLVIYPHTQNLGPGRGTDREDALRVQIIALQHHLDPYAARTFLGQRPTPLPGAIALAWPFYLLGRISLQNILWSGLFCLVLRKVFRLRLTAVVFLAVVVCLNLEPLNDFVTGSDYVVNALYVMMAVWLVVRAVDRDSPMLQPLLASLVFGVAVSSRPSYFMAVPPVLAMVAQRRGARTGLLATGAFLVGFFLTIAPVFWPHPVTGLFAELNEISHRKAQFLPTWFPIEGVSVLAGVATLSAFFVRLNEFRVYLTIAIATAVLIGIPMWFEIVAALRQGQPFPVESVYLFAPILFFALWAFHRLEQVYPADEAPAIH